MPKNKFQDVVFTIIMAAIMVYGMVVYNIALNTGTNPIHITDCALAGADIATVPYNVIVQMTKHPLTDAGIEKFQKDYKAVFGE